ncbi:MAG: ABC transporter permease [Spirochaetaceae bacterium]|jgi:putative ABC transport system permease protein|nr:ABC transporter permease [Spirochaetaceae bacterium]
MNHIKPSGTSALLTIAFRNIFRNKRRTGFCVIAVGTAVFFIVFYSSMIAGTINSIREVVRVFETGDIRIVSRQFEAESEYSPVQYPAAQGQSLNTVIAEIMAVPGVKAVFPRINTYASLMESSIKHAFIWGLKINEEIKLNNFNLTERNSGIIEGRYPSPGSNECAIGARLAEKAGLKIGDEIPLKTVSSQFSDKLWSPVVSGIFSFDYAKADGEVIIADYERLARLLVLNDETQQIIVYAENPDKLKKIVSEIEKITGEDNSVTEWNEQYWIVLMNMYQPFYFCLYLIFLIVACLLIINTVTMIIHERIKEIGMMGSLGMTRKEIVEVFFFESVFLSMAGASAGVIAGGILTGILSNFPLRWTSLTGESTFSAMPAANSIFLQFSLLDLAKSWCLGVVTASIFTLLSSLKSAFVRPVEALRR